MKFLTFMADIMTRRPVKIAFFIVLAVILSVTGVRHVKMATGNETLIEEESTVFQDNLKLENEFGGESIILLYETEEPDLQKLLTTESLYHMKHLESQLDEYDQVFSITSPVTIVEQIAQKQSDTYKEGVNETADGLLEMGEKLIEIGTNMQETDSAGTLPDFENKLGDLNSALSSMMEGQKKLDDGTTKLVGGYGEFAKATKQTALKLQQMAETMGSNPDMQNNQQMKQLQQLSSQLLQLSGKMAEAGEKAAPLQDVPDKTIEGLSGIQKGMNSQSQKLTELKETQSEQAENLTELASGLIEMGENLITISENLTTILDYSDIMQPGLPESDKTLEKMIYEDDGQLRSMFDDVVLDDQYMIMMIKLDGGLDDAGEGEVVDAIKGFTDDNHLDSIDVIVSGKPVLDDSIRSSMKDSMQKMMMLSILLMVIVLSLVFRVRWRIFPLVAILAAVIATVGLMGLLSVPITMVSMAVFPILIGLGIDYAIQFQSRYEEEMEKGVVQHEKKAE